MNFSTTTEILRQALCQVFSQIEIDTEVKDRFTEIYIHAHQSGSPRAEQQAAYDTIMQSDWRWQEFEEWRIKFNDLGQWPYLWVKERLHEMPDSNFYTDEYWQKRIARILVHTITMRAYSLRDEQQKIECGSTQRFADSADDTCPIETEICRKFNIGLLTGLPPFFPGDRTSLVDEVYMEMLNEEPEP